MTDLGVVPDVVVVPCSGGGLIAGCSIAVKAEAPEARVIAAEPEYFDDTARSLSRANACRMHPAIRRYGCIAGSHTRQDDVRNHASNTFGGVVVTEDEVRRTIRAAFLDAHIVVEPGGAVGLAAALSGKLESPAGNICVVLSGGNIDRKLFANILAD